MRPEEIAKNRPRFIRALCQDDYWYFDKEFFKSEAPTPEFHREIIELFDKQYEYSAIAAPRGHAKSTLISTRHNLWLMLYSKEPYILQVSCTYSQAAGVIASVKYNLDYNQKIRSTFNVKIIKEREDDLIIETQYGRSRLVAKGRGQPLRGVRDERENRPTLIVCDDIEDDDRMGNPELRDDDWLWFLAELLPARSKEGKVRVIGTILHKDSLLQKLIKSEEWHTKVYDAIVAEGQALWPEMYSWDKLMQLKDYYAKINKLHVFFTEYRNNPIDPENVEFQRQWIRQARIDPEKIKDLMFTTTVDLASSKKDTAAYTAIVTCAWGMGRPSNVYVVDVRRGRWGVYETVKQLYDVWKVYNPWKIGFEKVAYQAVFKEVFEREMQRTGEKVRIEPIAAIGDKLERIRASFSLFALGQVWFCKKFVEFEEELTTFPNSITLDIMDAFAMQLKLHTVSPEPPPLKPKREEGGWLIDEMTTRRDKPFILGTY